VDFHNQQALQDVAGTSQPRIPYCDRQRQKGRTDLNNSPSERPYEEGSLDTCRAGGTGTNTQNWTRKGEKKREIGGEGQNLQAAYLQGISGPKDAREWTSEAKTPGGGN